MYGLEGTHSRKGSHMKLQTVKRIWHPSVAIVSLLSILTVAPAPVLASSGTEGASFLDIPVGAGPAALGSAYTALAADAYAATWNPAGLGFADAIGVSAQHLNYLESIHDDYLSMAVPLTPAASNEVHRGVGVSVQYLGTGNLTRTDIGPGDTYVQPGGSFSNHYGSYNVAYGQTVAQNLAVGLTGKLINAQLDSVSANAYAADLGAMYKLNEKTQLGATLTNLGTHLKFLDAGDSLPMAAHAAAAYQPNRSCLLTGEFVYPKTGLASGRFGAQWSPFEMLSLRAGYRTDTVKGLGGLAGFSAGVGLRIAGQEFAYAWLPYGDLGNTEYFSLLLRFGKALNEKRNLILYHTIRVHQLAQKDGALSPDDEQLMQLFANDNVQVAETLGGTK